MDGPKDWIGARIEWRVSIEGVPDVTFEARIDAAEDFGDGMARVSGALAGGGKFVLVAEELNITAY